MGKNGKVVGPQDKFDQREVSFTRLGMGRLGEGPKNRWLGESTDPFWRILYAYTRKENSLVNHLRKAVDGPVKPEQAPVQNPQEMSKNNQGHGILFWGRLGRDNGVGPGLCLFSPRQAY